MIQFVWRVVYFLLQLLPWRWYLVARLRAIGLLLLILIDFILILIVEGNGVVDVGINRSMSVFLAGINKQ